MPTRSAELDRQLAVIRAEKEAGRLSPAAESAFFRVAHLLAEAADTVVHGYSESRNSPKSVASAVPAATAVIGSAVAVL